MVNMLRLWGDAQTMIAILKNSSHFFEKLVS